jgi:hypothetical protein
MTSIQVTYLDDNSIKHICIVKSFVDLHFLQDRFYVAEYEVL